ncbi:MAG: bifunctional UDP-N-acetylglucosamine diphosphorylase/glucosamine-1-phosphate N-acetyltransferase GlmU [Anaerovoracaceae bacterium]|nr:bifunctional UDP-N-acetylglucosamine diphosphorylase/glucosamine-1-phosphate N-acetyltransferase GlmU [Bacillota bacterium]MDY2670610.1 bifunctional UDP-N-acetylglucosamine diphosphorylase/glucosamine-1-phosphate N-acetyltransferase GlmU [Anaerovoracaceae bacterium]
MNCKTAVILAAGAGTRMKSAKPKVLHEIMGRPMVSHVISQVRKSGTEKIIVVVGHGAQEVQEALSGEGVSFAVQEEQLGTGHAVIQALDQIPEEGDVFIVCGDTPLITGETLSKFADHHGKSGAALTVLTAEYDDPTGYGRIIRDADGRLLRIVEQKDADDEEKAVKEVNAGMYCVSAAFLRESLPKLTNDNAQKEYYITDLIAMAAATDKGAAAYCAEDADEIMGVNNRVQLAAAAKIMRKRVNERLMMDGVTIIDPDSTYIDDTVEIGSDTEIGPNTIIKGATKIGSNVSVGAGCQIEDSVIEDGVDILKSVVKESHIGARTHVGPFAYLRPGNEIGEECKVGDFVEFKNSVFGDGSKASHLAYIGDADVGNDCNVGCGVIFANYDGKHKHRTTVGDRVFIGSNSNLVAPVKVNDDAFIAAGTTVTKEVGEGALCVGRVRDYTEEGWVDKKDLKREKLHGSHREKK